MRVAPWILALAASISFAVAQEDTSSQASSATSATSSRASSTGTSSRTSSAAAATHTVRVGLDHAFVPDTVQAEPGDKIIFSFYPKNHSVVRAELGQPCIPYDYYHPGEPTFFSGPVEQDTPSNPLPTWTLEVNDTEPVYFYCSAPGSCIDYHMVGVINPNDTHTIEAQKEFLENGTTTFQLSSGEPFPEEGSVPSPSGTAPPGSTESSNPDPPSGGGPSLSPGAIAGIAIGGFVALLLAVGLVWFCGRKGGIEKGYRRSQAPPAAPMIETPGTEGHPFENPQKSPVPTHATFSSYGPPPGHMEGYRADSPGHFSTPASGMASPHTSYNGPSSPGFPGYAPVSQQPMYFEAPNSEVQPVELPDNTAKH